MDKKKLFRIKNGKECIIRYMTEEDIPQVVNTINSVAEERIYIANEGITDIERFRNHIMGQLDTQNFMVAEVDGKIVGNFNLQIGRPSKREHTAYIGELVIKEYRNLGIGTALMEIALEKANEKNIEKVYSSVFSTNERAINFYKKLGFEIEAILKKQFKIDGKYVDEVYMAKWL